MKPHKSSDCKAVKQKALQPLPFAPLTDQLPSLPALLFTPAFLILIRMSPFPSSSLAHSCFHLVCSFVVAALIEIKNSAKKYVENSQKKGHFSFDCLVLVSTLYLSLSSLYSLLFLFQSLIFLWFMSSYYTHVFRIFIAIITSISFVFLFNYQSFNPCSCYWC